MKVAITGSTGMIGTRLTRSLRAEGHAVTRIVRSYSGLPHGERGIVWHPEQGVIEAGRLEAHDLVIHLAAESLAGVWTPAKKRRIRESRAQGTTLLAKTLASLDAPPRVLFSASAVGIYGDR
ncbi:MAG: NAD-dependent epimerase/dehydratase family protein, partial [Gemmatimonadota bacterium]